MTDSTPNLSHDEIYALGRRHGEEDGKYDGQRRDQGLLAATVTRVSQTLAESDDRSKLIQEQAYLLAYVKAWGEEAIKYVPLSEQKKQGWHIEQRETLAGTTSPIWVKDKK